MTMMVMYSCRWNNCREKTKDNTDGVVGMAPGAHLWAVKVLDSNGNGFDSDIKAGIDYITQHANEIDVVNMSFGGGLL